jgi:hypothetical protein
MTGNRWQFEADGASKVGTVKSMLLSCGLSCQPGGQGSRVAAWAIESSKLLAQAASIKVNAKAGKVARRIQRVARERADERAGTEEAGRGMSVSIGVEVTWHDTRQPAGWGDGLREKLFCTDFTPHRRAGRTSVE